jgi:hypothetical protein
LREEERQQREEAFHEARQQAQARDGAVYESFVSKLEADHATLIAKKQAEIDDLYAELERKEAENFKLRSRLAMFTGEAMEEAQSESESLDEPGSVVEAVQRAEKDFGETLVFIDNAYESAEASPYEYPAKVYETLRAVSDVALRRGKGGLGKRVTDVFREYGIDYSPNESDFVRNNERLRGLRTFRCNGADQFFEEHIRLGTGFDPRHCLRIYLCWDAGEKRYIIGHVGEHLPNSFTN